jgi:hypothetical protein
MRRIIATVALAAVGVTGFTGTSSATNTGRPSTKGDDYSVNLLAGWILPKGTSVQLTYQPGPNCTKDEKNDAFTVTQYDGLNPFPHDVPSIFIAKSSGVCGYEYSYANYRVTATLPGGKTLTRAIRIAQTDFSPGHYAVQCGSGDLGCENFDVPAHNAFAYFRKP